MLSPQLPRSRSLAWGLWPPVGKAADVFVGGGRGSQRMRGVGWGRLEQMRRPLGPRKAGEEGGRTAVFELRFIGNSLWSADLGRWSRIFIVCTRQEALECVLNKHCFGYNSRGAKGRKGAPNQGISSKPSSAFSVLSLPNPQSSEVSPGDLSSVLRASQRTSGCLATGLGWARERRTRERASGSYSNSRHLEYARAALC